MIKRVTALFCVLLLVGAIPFFGQVVAVLCHPASGGATFTYIGTGKNTGTCDTSPCYATYAATAGNLLIIDYIVDAASTPTIAAHDDHSNTFATAVTGSSGTKYYGETYICSAVSGIAEVSVSSTVITKASVVVREYHYTGGTCALDKVSAAGSGTGTSITGGSITTTIANELISGAVFQTSAAQAVTGSGSYTNRNDSGDGASGITVSGLDRIVSSTGTYSVTGTVGGSASWVAYTISYQ